MSDTAGGNLLDRLIEWGVHTVYGYPGDGISGILGAFEERTDRLRFIQVRHEEMAAFMACAHAKFTGEVGVCMATSGPGAIHLLNGLYDAKLDHQPVIAIVGQTYARALGGSHMQEVDLLSLFGDVAGAYCEQVNDPSAVRHVVDRAMRIATAERTVTCVIVPADVQAATAVPQQPRADHTLQSGVGYWEPRLVPTDDQLQQAAAILNAGSRVAMLVGAGALDATDEVIAVADALGAGVAKALLGRAAVPDDVPFCTNTIGLLGTEPSSEMMKGCDTLLMVGSGFPYSEFLPEPGTARAVQVDRDARMLSLRYPMELALVGDSRQTLAALLPLLERKQDRSWQESIIEGVADWWRLMDRWGESHDQNGRIRPQGLFRSLSEHLPAGAIVAADSGSAANWYARHVRLRRGMKASLSGNLASMAAGVPYAIAAKVTHPDRVAVALMGDGAMQMSGSAELLTAARYYREWSDPRLIVLVLNNEDLNQVTWEQRVLSGDPRFDDSQRLPAFDYARYAESIGLRGIRVERADQVDDAWREAFASDRPVVIDALTDPDEPPLPPRITFEQAKKYAASLLKDPRDGLQGAVQATRELLQQHLPKR